MVARLSLPMAKPLAVGKVSDFHKPFLPLARGRRVFGSALPVAKQFSSFGARTGRARQNRFAQAKVKVNDFPLAGSLGRAHRAKGKANDELKGV